MLDENIRVVVEIFANAALIRKIRKHLDFVHKTRYTVCVILAHLFLSSCVTKTKSRGSYFGVFVCMWKCTI